MSKQQDLRPSFKYIKIKCIGIHLHACTHSKNTSSHTCCAGFVFVYSIYDGCTLMCPKTKQEDNLCIHTTIIDYTKAILFRNYWSYDYHFLSMKKKKKKPCRKEQHVIPHLNAVRKPSVFTPYLVWIFLSRTGE